MDGVLPSNHRTRRDALRLLGLGGIAALAAACAPPPAASPPAAPPKASSPSAAPTVAPAAKASPVPGKPAPSVSPATGGASAAGGAGPQWDQLLAAAKQEGKVSIATYSGTGYRRAMEAFQTAVPGITVDHSQFQSSSRDFRPRLRQEHDAGLYSWDLAFMPSTEMLRQARPAGSIEPIRPLIVRPDVLDDKAWRDGFEGGFRDDDKKWGYALINVKSQVVWVNSDQVKDGELKGVKDLLDPKWKGKILGGDLRTKGSGFWPGTVMRLKTGSDDIIRQLYKDQEVVLSTDARQMTEFMVRGRYPIGVGAVDDVILRDFQAQGLGKNLKSVELPDVDYLASSSDVAWLLTKAPHPNAAKVFINWVLTRDAQIAWGKELAVNSRRADVEPADPEISPTPGIDYIQIDVEKLIEEHKKTQDVAKEVLS